MTRKRKNPKKIISPDHLKTNVFIPKRGIETPISVFLCSGLAEIVQVPVEARVNDGLGLLGAAGLAYLGVLVALKLLIDLEEGSWEMLL